MKIGRRFSAIGAAGALALTGTLVSAAPSGAQTAGPAASGPLVRITGQAPPLPRGAVRLGPLAPGARLHLDVGLKVRDQAALTAFLAGLSDRASPLFHRFLRPGQFGPRFGASLAAVAAVRAALRQAGLSPGAVTANRLVIPISASAAAAERAFRVALVTYRLPGGRIAYANTGAPAIAAGVAKYVAGVLGLDNLYQEHSMLARPSPPSRPPGARPAGGTHPVALSIAAGPQPCTAASNEGAATGSYTANQLAGYYYMSPFYGKGDLGSGVRVGIFELEPNSTSDISAYEACYGVSTPVTYTTVDGGAGSGAGSGEAALDIEDVLGLAPAVTIDVYQGPNNATGPLDTYNALVTADKDAVITTSWGQCEAYRTASAVSMEQAVFAQANAQGQTVFASAGDDGSTDCRTGPSMATVSADDPGSQPYVNGVGGTTATSTAETVWNDSSTSSGAGGGGVSAFWCMPSYQYKTAVPGLVNADSVKNSGCPASVGQYVRQVPDVTADADPFTGYVIYYAGSWTAIGGTSAAAPLWAAVAALIDDSPFCKDWASGDAGVLPQGLWATASADQGYIYTGGKFEPEIVFDVTQGNNDYTPSGYTGGLYPATAGYDMASGLGSPLVGGLGKGGIASWFYPGLAAAMCVAYATKYAPPAVSAISPTSGTIAGGTTVTITGSGFLPIAGADMAEIGTKLIKASCSSTTKCTIKTPKHAAGTVDIRMDVEDFGLSPVTTADKFTYQ